MDKTTTAVQRQITAMGSRYFEVGLFKPEAAAVGHAVMIPRTWDAETLMKSILWLRYQNADGRNVYVRPKGEHNLTLVDDLSADAVKRMKANGFAPAIVVETSSGNFQAWLKHPKILERETSTLAARELAKNFGGDLGAADWRHFGRLAGFTNRKEKYASETGVFPFVKLIEADGVQYPAGERFVAAIAAEKEARMRAAESGRLSPLSSGRTSSKDIDAFRADSRYGGDGTRIDLAYAVYALARGADVETVSAAIRSRDLSHKGDEKRQAQYVERTVAKAASRVVVLQR